MQRTTLAAILLFPTLASSVEVKRVAAQVFSGNRDQIRTITVEVPPDTAEIVIDLTLKRGETKHGYARCSYQDPGERPAQRHEWWAYNGVHHFTNPSPGTWRFQVRGDTDYSGFPFKAHLIPYREVVQPQAVPYEPHELCQKEYLKITLPPDTIQPGFLTGAYGFEIWTANKVRDVFAFQIAKGTSPQALQFDRSDVERVRITEPSPELSYYVTVSAPRASALPGMIGINWFTAKIDAVAGAITAGRELWMVTHGRADNPENAASHRPFRTLAATLAAARIAEGAAATAMVLDWNQGAGANTGLGGLEGTRYINEVALTARRLFDKCGVSPGSLNLVGHSWGSLVSNDLAASYTFKGSRGKVARIVALDPAESGNQMGVAAGSIVLGDQYNSTNLSFSRWAMRSLALVTSNGYYGSESRARTAHVSIRVDAPDLPNWSLSSNADARHALPVDTFYFSIQNRSGSDIASTIWAMVIKPEHTASNFIFDPQRYGAVNPWIYQYARPAYVSVPSALVTSVKGWAYRQVYRYQISGPGTLDVDFFPHVAIMGVRVNAARQYAGSLGLGIMMKPLGSHVDKLMWFVR